MAAERGEREPGRGRRVVRGAGLAAAPAAHEIESHDREPPEAAQEVGVPVEPEPRHAPAPEPGLFEQLAPGPALDALARFQEAARHVEVADARRVRALE